jgi:hypothetical protein
MIILYLQAGGVERLLQLGVGEALAAGIQVEPQAPREQGWLLGYDGQAGAQILQGVAAFYIILMDLKSESWLLLPIDQKCSEKGGGGNVIGWKKPDTGFSTKKR